MAATPDSWFTPANGNVISYLRALEAAGGILAPDPSRHATLSRCTLPALRAAACRRRG
ncbi:MAG: hypothetical protein U0Z44_06315 [Kouleothrix sp.]